VKPSLPPMPSLNRRSQITKPKVEIIIACEGRNTEPMYLQDCVDWYGAGLVKSRVLPQRGTPLTVVQVAIEARNELVEKRRKSHNSFDACFRVWAVFDRDEHPYVQEALTLAHDNKIDVAFSNPCFEIWPLLHLGEYGSQDGRHAVQERLTAMMPTYDHAGGAIIDFSAIRDYFQIALKRAKILQAARKSEGNPHACPYTSVGDLVEKIMQNGKTGFLRNR